MADILRVTTPLVNKNQPVQPKTGVDPTTAFQIQDASKIIQTHNQSELLKQNNGMLAGGDAPTILANLLRDPSVTVSYLKNIFLLEEVFQLLRVNNKTMTQEIEQIFQTLLIPPEEIADELVRQANDATLFKGDIFDFLRQISDAYPPQSELQGAVANLLKSMNNMLYKRDILNSIANNLSFLQKNLNSSQTLSQSLLDLIAKYRKEGAEKDFPALKQETLALFKSVEESILFSPKLQKILSIATYNLSRYNDNTDYLNESLSYLRQFLTIPERQQLSALSQQFLQTIRGGAMQEQGEPNKDLALTKSKVMEALIQMIRAQSEEESPSMSESGKIDKIIHSLLSSPCNFTPLLHFVVPCLFQDIRAFTEIWINPSSDEKDMPPGVGNGKHLLLVIDVESVGRFEAELFVYGQTIDFVLLCPPGYERPFEVMLNELPKALKGAPYQLGQMRIGPLERPRSLMDVFKSLPYKRVGVDVKI